jgi:Uncharacterised nucleotidyltransferase
MRTADPAAPLPRLEDTPVRGREVAAALGQCWRSRPPAWEPTLPVLAAVQSLLIGSGAGALAWRRLRDGEPARSPGGFALQQSYRLHAIEALLHERQLARVIARLRSAGVEPLVGRGWAAGRHYPESGLRPYQDFDLYVGQAQHEAARRALEGESTAVALHIGCAELNDRPWSLLNERARSVPLGSGQVRVFGPEDHLRLMALHMLRHGAWRPLWMCDVGAVLETSGQEFVWDDFLGGDALRTDWACCALVLARELLGAPLAGAPSRVTERKLPGWMRNTVLRQWARPVVRPPRSPRVRSPAAGPSAVGPSALWPNGIEATVGVRGRFNAVPRLPFQLAECVSRTARFTLGLPRALAR